MSYTQTQIGNLALSMVGDLRIADINESSAAAAALRDCYDVARDFTLTAHEWRFALAHAVLARSATPPVAGYAYAYQLPGDFLRIGNISDRQAMDRAIDQWAHIGGQIHTSAESVYIDYLRREINPALYSPEFVDAMACKLASLVAQRIHGSANARSELQQEFERRLRHARALNSTTQPNRRLVKGSWVRARHGRGRSLFYNDGGS